ncbi:MAG: ABC transporter permease [Deltaproteobacteria bacterium]|nr:ABC transporter permease [Deltaproteobacteria bacterium]
MKNKFLFIGFVLVFLISFLGIVSPYLTSYTPSYQDLSHRFAGPSFKHILGQDEYGADVFTNLVYGARLSLYVSVVTTFFCCLIGLIFGSFAAFFGKWVDQLLMRIVDVFLAFPGILLAIGIAALLERSAHNIILALTITGWTSYARLVRGQILSIREKEFIISARALGFSNARIVAKHVWPNILAPLFIQASFGMAGVIIAESSLSFLGVGTGGDLSSWGMMLDQARRHISDISRIHLLLPPLFAIMMTVLGFNFLGDGLLQKCDPSRKLPSQFRDDTEKKI